MSANKKIKGTRPGATHVVGPGKQGAAEFAGWYRDRSGEAWDGLDIDAVAALAAEVVRAQEGGRAIYVMGNGGSAATASHLATDLCKTAANGRDPLVKCLALNDNVSFMTAISNDLSYDEVFSRQLQNFVKKGDLVILVTGSGNSTNLLRAAALARKAGAKTAALLGFDGGKLMPKVDIPILVKSDQYGVIEDLHMSIGHIVAFYLKQR